MHLFCADFSSIEGRVLAWVADETKTLADYRAGRCAYCVFASTLFGVPYQIIKDGYDAGEQSCIDMRFEGKTGTLACGYQGWESAIKRFAPNIPIERREEIARRWRESSPKSVEYWRRTEKSALAAVRNPGRTFSFGKVVWGMHKGNLLCKLPSGRYMTYVEPQLRLKERFGKPKAVISYMTVDAGKWKRVLTYGGKLTENCISGNAEILTPYGWTELKDYRESTPVWDGVEFVYGGKLIDRGVQAVVRVDGVKLTPDHKILTIAGWETANASQRKRLDREKVLLPYDYKFKRATRWALGVVRPLRLRSDRRSSWKRYDPKKRSESEILWLHDKVINRESTNNARYEPASRFLCMAVNARSMQTYDASGLEKLRRARRHCLQKVAKFFSRFLGRHAGWVQTWFNTRSYRQQQRLFEKKLQMDEYRNPKQQSKKQYIYPNSGWENDCCQSSKKVQYKSDDDPLQIESGMASRQNTYHPRCKKQNSCRVYDILNCGPRHQFVVRDPIINRPFIVHNCVQAISRDILAEAMLRVDPQFPIMFHVHDEIISCVDGSADFDEFMRLMTVVPSWAKGLPIGADGFITRRYHK